MMRVFEVEDGVESGLCVLFFYLKKNKIANPKPNRRQKSRKLKNFKLGPRLRPQVKVTGHHPVTK